MRVLPKIVLHPLAGTRARMAHIIIYSVTNCSDVIEKEKQNRVDASEPLEKNNTCVNVPGLT